MNCRGRDVNVVQQTGERLDIVVRRGVTVGPYHHQINKSDGTVYDLTGHVFAGQVRDSADTMVAEFEFDMPSPTEGWYEFSIPFDAMLDVPPGRYNFDTEMVLPDGTVMPVFFGVFDLKAEVTK